MRSPFIIQVVSEFKNWATDAPVEYIDRILNDWKKGNPDSTDITEVEGAVW